MAIRILPPEVASKIAAGEVVERPASVVKELIENALDAAARHIAVELGGGGKRLIRVSDDGIGIPSNEVELAFHRYATSKLSRIEDLHHITTLGFRGEALAAIAAVSHLTLITRAVGEPMGIRLHLEAGRVVQREAVGAPQGTVVSVENLFYNVPARLKFLKQESTERAHISALVSRYAMAYPHVRFVLTHGHQEVLHTTGSGDLRTVLSEVYGVETASQMIAIERPEEPPRPDLPPITVSGYVGLPNLNRSNRNQIVIFVNGRWIQDANLTYAIVQAYHTMLMVGRYPVAVVMITLPPEEVDVNVHPTKAEVRFRRPDAVCQYVPNWCGGRRSGPPAASGWRRSQGSNYGRWALTSVWKAPASMPIRRHQVRRQNPPLPLCAVAACHLCVWWGRWAQPTLSLRDQVVSI